MEAPNGENECVNILLLGETGNGKSTLINAFANYQAYKTFDKAKNGSEMCLIPTTFTFMNEALNETLVQAGSEDENECLEVGESATMSCKFYVFRLTVHQRLRFIDSSGFAATQGMDQDRDTVSDVIDYVSQFQHMHALAIVVKAHQNALSPHFERCLEPLLEKFGPVAAQNIVIILTHCKKPDQTLKMIKEKLNKICKELKMTEKDMIFNKENVFCFENQAFLNVLAAKRGADVTSMNNKSLWESASKEFQRLISNLAGKMPLKIASTFVQTQTFAQNLSYIVQIILTNIYLNQKTLREKCTEWLVSSERFKSADEHLRTFRIVDINVEALDQKIIVCNKCTGGTCCSGNGNSLKKISRWKFMKKGVCSACKCKAKYHVQCAFKTTEEEKFYNYSKYEEAWKFVEEYTSKLVEEKIELIDGIKLLIDFLMANSMSIRKKTSHSADKDIVKRLHLLVYKEKLKVDKYNVKRTVSAEEMQNNMQQLKALPIYGAKITSAFEAEEAANRKNRSGREVVVQSKNSFFKLF